LPSGRTEPEIASEEDCGRGRLLQATGIAALLEHPMKTQLKICNEADYLQAHLTFIVSKPGPVNPVFHDFKERVAWLLKKWIKRRMLT
jgi:hypothetical protein